jgi:hypothetical protein
MTGTISRRNGIVAIGFSAVLGKLTPATMRAQSLPVRGIRDD